MTGNQRCHHLVRPNAQQHNHTQHYQGRRQVPPTRDSLAPDPSAQHFGVVPSPACRVTMQVYVSAMFVGDVQIALPVVGSYVARAIQERDLAAVG